MDRANLDLNNFNIHSIYHMERKNVLCQILFTKAFCNLNKNYWKNKYRIDFCFVVISNLNFFYIVLSI